MALLKIILIPLFSLLLLGFVQGEPKGDLKPNQKVENKANFEDVFQFLEKNAPEILTELKQLKPTDQKSYKSALSDAVIAQKEYYRVLKYDKAAAKSYLQMYRNDFEVIGVADLIALSKDPKEIEKLRLELKELIGHSFDHWVIYERARLKHLQDELTKLQKSFEKDSKEKESVIKHDVESIIKESKAFWKTNPKSKTQK